MNFIDRHAYDWGAACARALFPLFRRRRRIAIDNILKAGITADPREAARIARVSWGHLAGHICEALRVPHVVTRENWREHLDVHAPLPICARGRLATAALFVSRTRVRMWYTVSAMRPIVTETNDFEIFRVSGQIYVDKMSHLHRMITDSSRKYFFCARLRRFGKSLSGTTMKSIFLG